MDMFLVTEKHLDQYYFLRKEVKDESKEEVLADINLGLESVLNDFENKNKSADWKIICGFFDKGKLIATNRIKYRPKGTTKVRVFLSDDKLVLKPIDPYFVFSRVSVHPDYRRKGYCNLLYDYGISLLEIINAPCVSVISNGSLLEEIKKLGIKDNEIIDKKSLGEENWKKIGVTREKSLGTEHTCKKYGMQLVGFAKPSLGMAMCKKLEPVKTKKVKIKQKEKVPKFIEKTFIFIPKCEEDIKKAISSKTSEYLLSSNELYLTKKKLDVARWNEGDIVMTKL